MEKISDKQGFNLMVMFIFGSALIMGAGSTGGIASWLSIILAIVSFFPMIMIYARIITRYPGEDIFDIAEKVFGKYIGKLFILAYTWFAFHLGALVLRNFGEFMNTVGLPETPKIVPIIVFALICAISVKSGIETIARCSDYFIIIVLALLFLFAFLTIPIMDTEKMLPILDTGIKPVLKGTFDAFSFPFAETILFIAVFDSLKEPALSGRIFVKSLLISGFIISFIAARNIMVLGPESASSVYFPSYSAISRVNVGNFLQRLEISVTIVFLLCGFIKISICMLAATKGFTKLFGFKDYRRFVVPIGLLMVNLSYIIYDNIMEMFEWAQNIWPYYAFPFQVIFPLIILIAIEIKAYAEKKKEAEGESSQV